ncbi:MAG: hypothetical protein ALAOOOJD_01257 [bacterium]|nr:hypothetical protein [bacterium]
MSSSQCRRAQPGPKFKSWIFLFSLFFLQRQFALGQVQRPPVPQFSFMQLRLVPVNPAGRPTSLGGAFTGVADDATAAAINPAGLSFLLRPEISLSHALGWRARDFPVGRTEEEDGTRRQLHFVFDQTFVNIAYPYRGFTFALYRQVAFRSAFDFSRQQFLTLATARPLTLEEQLGASGNFPGIGSEFFAEVIHNAVAIAKALHRRFRLGLTVRATELHLQLHEQHYFDPDLWLRSSFNGENIRIGTNRAEGLYRTYHLHKNGFAPSWSLGVVAELHSHLTAGIVYQYLPTFNVENRITLPAYRLPDRTPADGQDDEIRFPPQEMSVPFQLDLPDHFGVGLAWKPNARTLLAADIALCRNHTLLRHLNQDLPQDDKPAGNGSYIDPDGPQDVRVKNLVAWRGGLEYTLFKWKFNFPIRCGFYTEPNFGLQAVSGDVTLKREYPEELAYFHFTGGIGLVLKNVRFETSVDLSSTLVEAIGSAVVSF